MFIVKASSVGGCCKMSYDVLTLHFFYVPLIICVLYFILCESSFVLSICIQLMQHKLQKPFYFVETLVDSTKCHISDISIHSSFAVWCYCSASLSDR